MYAAQGSRSRDADSHPRRISLDPDICPVAFICTVIFQVGRGLLLGLYYGARTVGLVAFALMGHVFASDLVRAVLESSRPLTRIEHRGIEESRAAQNHRNRSLAC